MDRHTCKLCFRRFSNGRALGGHMRSHVASATMAAMKAQQLRELSASPSSSSSASHGGQGAPELEAEVADQAAAAAVGGSEAKQLVAYYGLRENPRKSYRLVDPEFSSTFATAAAGSSVVLQDRESETESSKPPPPPPLRRRSSRRRRCRAPPLPPPGPEAVVDPEPVSSVSDTTPEEDVARCLMLLSRDVWTTTDSSTAEAKKRTRGRDKAAADEEDDEEGEQEQQLDAGSEEDERAAIARSRKGGRRRYQCGTCGKVFRSYQALGGHRASHKNARPCAPAPSPARFPSAPPVAMDEGMKEEYEHLRHQIHRGTGLEEVRAFPPAVSADRRRVHECPVCFRVFGSGQALGGHKRSHLVYGSGSTNPSVLLPYDVAAATAASGGGPPAGGSKSTAKKFAVESLIDLNLPAPMEEEVEMSAVFDAEQ